MTKEKKDTSSVDIGVLAFVAPNQAPSSSAGPDQVNIAAGASVSLDGSGSSDPDGTIATYLWEQTVGDTVAISDDAIAEPSFTAPDTAAAQMLTFRLTVTDNDGSTAADTVNVGILAQLALADPLISPLLISATRSIRRCRPRRADQAR